jgi:hypothetical protein
MNYGHKGLTLSVQMHFLTCQLIVIQTRSSTRSFTSVFYPAKKVQSFMGRKINIQN